MNQPQHHPHPPPVHPGPEPVPGFMLEVMQLRETVETQARTIRLLLANYDALLAKVKVEIDQTGPVVISATAPANPKAGNLWWDGTNLQVYDGTAWQVT